jgi:hypothetical protein
VEGRTYVCRWTQQDDAYVLTLDENPNLSVVDTDFESAADELASQIVLWNGDGEAVLDFVPARPVPGAEKFTDSLLSLDYNEGVKAANRDPSLYEGGICERCQFGIGERSKIQLEIETVPKNDMARVQGLLPWTVIYSEQFLKLLSDEERGQLVMQPVSARTGTRHFFELVGGSIADHVGVRGAEYPSLFQQSWSCKTCKRRNFIVQHPDFAGTNTFLASSPLPVPLPDVFVHTGDFGLNIAVTATRWKTLVKKTGTRGISTSAIGVIADALVDARPELPEPSAFEWIL